MSAENEGLHFHHIAGMGGGYMPDDHGVYDSFDDAVNSVLDDISIDTQDGDVVPVRTYDRAAFDSERGTALWVGYYPEDVSPHDLGWYYEVFPANDGDPDHEDCRAILNGEKEAPLY